MPNIAPLFEESASVAITALAQYLHESQQGQGAVMSRPSIHTLMEQLALPNWIQGGMQLDTLATFLSDYLAATTRVHHPAFISHQVAVPHFASALADLMHGITNNAMAVYEMGPAATVIELTVLDWMLEKVGWKTADQAPDVYGAGVLTHGGSVANLTALLAARARIAPNAWEMGTPNDLVVLAPPTAHYSIARAISILGLGRHAIRSIPVGENDRLQPDALPALYQQVQNENKRVMAVVASACATSTGLYDPLEETAQFCQAAGLWFHVDGAHGASALVSPQQRHKMRGVALADSLIWDAHKMLRTSTLCTAVLFREAATFERLFQQKASYLFYEHETPGIDLIHRTVECTKAGLGLKIFMVLAFLGEQGIAQYIDSRYAIAHRFYDLIRSRSGFECPYKPESNILCFRYGTNDAMQLRIREALLDEGQFHITSAEIQGRRYLRLSIMNPDTDETTINALLGAIEHHAKSFDIDANPV